MIEGNAYILVPTAITTSNLTSSTIADPDTGETAWNAATAYSVGDEAYLASNHTIYTRRVAGTTATSPDLDTTNWAASGRQNKWAMFDNSSGTVSTSSSPLTVVIEPGQVGGLFADGLVGREMQVTVKDAAGGTVVYDETIDLDDTVVTSVYEWFFNDFEQKSTVVLVDLPSQFFDPEVTVSITSTAGSVACESLRVGVVYNVGATVIGAQIEIVNYSIVETDGYGVTSVTERGFLKRLNCKIRSSRSNFKRMFRLLATLKDTLAVYIASSSDDDLTPLCVQGIPDDWSIDVDEVDAYICNLLIQGISQE